MRQQDDYFGVDVHLDSINDAVFVSENRCCENANSASKRGRVEVQMQGESSVTLKKVKRNSKD